MTGNPPLVRLPKHASYRGLLGEQAWRRLHRDIRKRFDHDQPQQSIRYQGFMDEVGMSTIGLVLAQACRLIGTPLALHRGHNIATVVDVYPNKTLNGMTWDRLYQFPNKAPNRVSSTKCIQSEAGLIEVVGCGFGMSLSISEREGAIVFESTAFFCKLKGLKVALPNWLTPGRTTVKQTALDNGEFRFDLEVVHTFLGRMFWQSGVFKAQP
ncbi:MAG TPA: DUF4166 domain-containing protein [Porticoccus sp.]|nr:DUF4166 domain-containing protein [Porticoccus sp.]